jgi:short-subunit dehydrogenase
MNTSAQYVLITGATSGIGYALAKVFAENGYNLVLVARTTADLSRVADELNDRFDVDVLPITKDLFQPHAAFDLYEELKGKQIPIEILVNDAGQGEYGEFLDSDLERQLQIIQLNVSALTTLTYLFVNDMLERGGGKVLNIASIVSEIPAPLQAVYGGTKAFVLSFSEALRSEVKDKNIVVTALQPGATDTDFFNKAGAQDSKILQQPLDDPAKVARDGFDALMKNDDKVVSGMKNKMQSLLSNITPDTKLADRTKKQTAPVDKNKTQ